MTKKGNLTAETMTGAELAKMTGADGTKGMLMVAAGTGVPVAIEPERLYLVTVAGDTMRIYDINDDGTVEVAG